MFFASPDTPFFTDVAMMLTTTSVPFGCPPMIPPPRPIGPEPWAVCQRYVISLSCEPLRSAAVSGVNATSSRPESPVALTDPLPTIPGLPAARIGADCWLTPLTPALFVAETVNV
ncbi:hypothetical protein D3C73_1152970 [compost metagenome]